MEVDIDTLDIDITRLDQEWLNQPKMARQAIDKYRIANKKVRHHKAMLARTEAEIKIDMRNDPAGYNLEKVTEGALNEKMITTKRYRDALGRLRVWEDRADKAKADVDVLEIRKRALEHLVRLHGQDYFATPRIDISSEDNFNESAVREKQKARRQKRAR